MLIINRTIIQSRAYPCTRRPRSLAANFGRRSRRRRLYCTASIRLRAVTPATDRDVAVPHVIMHDIGLNADVFHSQNTLIVM